MKKVVGGAIGFGVTITASVGLIVWGNKEENQIQGLNMAFPIVIVGFIPLSIITTGIGALIGSQIK